MNEQEWVGEKVHDYYINSVLPSQRVQDILLQARQAQDAHLKRRPLSRIGWGLGLAAALFLCLLPWNAERKTLAAYQVAADAVLNYLKGKDKALFEVSEYSELAGLLPRLDFSLTDLDEQLPEGLQLRGGRYCSLQGEVAAQIALEQPSQNRMGILYVARNLERFALAKAGRLRLASCEVQIWKDEERIYVLLYPPGRLSEKDGRVAEK